MSVTVNGNPYNDFSSAFTLGVPAQGVYCAQPDIGVPPVFDLPIHDRREITFPGVADTGEKDYGANQARNRFIYVDFVVVGTRAQYCANLAALHAVIKNNTRYTISFDSQTFNGCKMAGPHGPPIAYFHMRGVVVGVFRIVFKKLSDQN